MSNRFFPLHLRKKQLQTDDAAVFLFEKPDHEAFRFEAGQYITVKVDINGQSERRAYSLCTSPDDAEMGFCVKRLSGGKVSNYLLDKVQEGQILDIMPPEGRFVARTNPDQRKTYYLIGAGSGITPLMSIARKVLEDESGSTIHLLYGNRSEDTIIFKREIEEMEERYRGQFNVKHILSQPAKKKASGIGGLFGMKKPSWQGRIGRIDAQELRLFLAENESLSSDRAYYICGPGGMIETVERELLSMGHAAKQIHTERFFTAPIEEKDRIHPGATAGQVSVTLDGKQHQIQVASGKTILETLVGMGLNPP